MILVFFGLLRLILLSKQLGWLSIFLKVYIRAFQQASDLDDTVEEKLLIGDRPKQTGDFDRNLSLRERLVERTEDEFSEVDCFRICLHPKLTPF